MSIGTELAPLSPNMVALGRGFCYISEISLL